MKKISVIGMALLFFTTPLLSAEETVFRAPYESGGFAALVIKATSFVSGTDMVTGARVGWIVNHSLILGGGIYTLTSTSPVPEEARKNYHGRELKLTATYWGAEFEYAFLPQRLVHLSVSSFIGTGGIGYIDQYDNDFHITDGVYVIEPALHGTLNISRWFRVSPGISYRFVTDTSLVGLDNTNMSGISGIITLRFGRF